MKRLSLKERSGTTVSSSRPSKAGPCGSKPLVRLSKAAGASRKKPDGIGSDVTAWAVAPAAAVSDVVVSGSTRSVEGVKRCDSAFGTAICALDCTLNVTDTIALANATVVRPSLREYMLAPFLRSCFENAAPGRRGTLPYRAPVNMLAGNRRRKM